MSVINVSTFKDMGTIFTNSHFECVNNSADQLETPWARLPHTISHNNNNNIPYMWKLANTLHC